MSLADLHRTQHRITLGQMDQVKRGSPGLTHLYHRALDFTANEHPTPLDHREVHHIAKSVARWVWRRFSAEGFAAKQAARGRIGGPRIG